MFQFNISTERFIPITFEDTKVIGECIRRDFAKGFLSGELYNVHGEFIGEWDVRSTDDVPVALSEADLDAVVNTISSDLNNGYTSGMLHTAGHTEVLGDWLRRWQ